MELIRFARLTDARRAELEGDEVDPFDAAQLHIELEWRQKEQYVGLTDTDGTLVASAGVVLAQVVAESSPLFSVVGIGGVIVRSTHRGRGLAKRIVGQVIELAETVGPDIAILFCHPDRAGLYRRFGFVEVEDPVYVEHRDAALQMPMVTMWRALREGAALPPGPLRLLGSPF